MHETLMGTGVAVLNQMAAISGLGGIGKTQTAIEYAYREYGKTYDWVFWVNASTGLSVVSGMADIARSLNFSEGTVDELASLAKQWLESADVNNRWLLIFDNADEPPFVKSWRPRNPNGRILLTSRAQRFTNLGIKAPIAVKVLSPEESIAFLQDRTDRLTLDAGEQVAATALAQELAGLPLALEQAAAYVARTEVSFGAYWKAYQQQRLHLLEKGLPETGDYPQSVATTWLLNFEEVERRSPASIPILQLSAVLAPDNISEKLLLDCAEEFGLEACTDELALGEQLAALADFSLIQRERETVRYSIHRMVQSVVWHRLIPEERHTWIQRAITGLDAVFPDVKFENWALCGQLVPHVQSIAKQPETATLENPRWVLLLSQAGYYLDDQGRYGEVEPLMVRSLAVIEQQLGADHPLTATSLNNLAGLYQSQGRYGEAELLLVRSLALREQQLGADYPDTATSLNNLAESYRSQGQYEEAEPLYLRSLAIIEQQLGVDHPLTAQSLNNLALMYKSQGRYGEAEPLYVRSLAIIEQRLGTDHPLTAGGLNNLAALYYAQGRYGEAEPLMVRSLAFREQQLGPDHPDTAQSLNNLAKLYYAQGRYGEAEPLMVRSLAIFEQCLGSQHPTTQLVRKNLQSLRSKLSHQKSPKLWQWLVLILLLPFWLPVALITWVYRRLSRRH